MPDSQGLTGTIKPTSCSSASPRLAAQLLPPWWQQSVCSRVMRVRIRRKRRESLDHPPGTRLRHLRKEGRKPKHASKLSVQALSLATDPTCCPTCEISFTSS